MTIQRLRQDGFASGRLVFVPSALVLTVLLGTVMSGALLLGTFVLGTEAGAETREGKPRLLLLPIVVHSSEAPEYLRDGLSDMLSARFDRIGALTLVRNPTTSSGATNLEDALKMARKAGVDYVLYGSFTRFGQGASLDVQCAPVASGNQREPLREIFVHSGSIGEIIPDLDELAGKVSRFARGENVSQPAAGSPTGISRAGTADGAGAGAAAGSAEVEALTGRVEALEAALKELLERGTETGTDG